MKSLHSERPPKKTANQAQRTKNSNFLLKYLGGKLPDCAVWCSIASSSEMKNAKNKQLFGVIRQSHIFLLFSFSLPFSWSSFLQLMYKIVKLFLDTFLWCFLHELKIVWEIKEAWTPVFLWPILESWQSSTKVNVVSQLHSSSTL